MLLVLLIHYAGTIESSPEIMRQSEITSITTMFCHSLSVVCVNCFILISGYFGITWKAKSFSSLIYQILFWLVLGFVLATFSGQHYALYGIFEIGKFFGGRWFVPAYIGLYILSPLLNAFVKGADNKTLLRYILVFYLYSTIVGYLLHSEEFNQGMSVISLVGLYMIGAYLRHTDMSIFKYKSSVNLLIYLLLAVFLVVVNVLSLKTGLNKSPFGYLNPIVILMSVYLFLFFQKLDIGYVKVINILAGSAFSIYLFHMHPAIYGTYQDLCRTIATNGYLTPVYLLLFFIGLYLIVFAIDQIRKLSFRLFYRNNKQ